MGVDRHHRACENSIFFRFLPPKIRRDVSNRMSESTLNCTVCDGASLRCADGLQSLVLLGAQAGTKDENGAYAFRFFNFVVRVSYFVQLQSWSLKNQK